MPSKDHKGDRFTRNGITVVVCEDCGYVHLDPLPEQAALAKLYSDEYYQSYNAGWFEKERREQWYWRKVYDQRLDYAASIAHWRSVYDHGAGCGWFIKRVQRRGWPYYGLEPNMLARYYADTVVDVELKHVMPPKRYGIVHCSLVLEHLLDPLFATALLYDRTLPGGVICVVVPNEFNPLQIWLRAKYDYSPLHQHHVNYFSNVTIQELMRRAGFDVVRVAGTFPMEWFALHGLNYVKHPKLGKYAHWLRMAVEATALSVDADRWERRRDDWGARGIGREVEIWAVKR